MNHYNAVAMPFNYQRPPVAASPVSVIVPLYQSAKHLTATVDDLLGQLRPLARDFEILLVDDGSTDGSAGLCQEIAAREPRVHLHRHEQTQGYGAALRTGLAAARLPLVFTMPANGCYQALDLNRLLQVIDQVDIACGYRRQRPWLEAQRQGWFAFLGFGLWLKDVMCPVRMYRRGVFTRIPIQSNGRFADVEILAKANFLECLLTEIDVSWKPLAEARPAWPGPAILSDARRLFRRPDFGPARVEEGQTLAGTT